MKTPFAVIALCAAVMSLSACDKTAPTPPKPTMDNPAPTGSGVPPPPVADPSLPPAESVFPPGSDAKSDPALGETDGTRKPKEESEEKLLPGQNNDHSAPLSPPK